MLGATGLRVSAVGLGTLTWGRDTEAEHAPPSCCAASPTRAAPSSTPQPPTATARPSWCSARCSGEVVDREDVVLCTKAGVRRTRRRGGRRHLAARPARTRWTPRSPGSAPTTWTCSASSSPTRPPRPTRSPRRSSTCWRRDGPATSAWRTTRPGAPCGWPTCSRPQRLAAVQVEYSLLERGIEREVLAAARELGAGVLAWSPLGRGVLTGKYRRTVPADSRAASAHLAGFVAPYLAATTAPGGRSGDDRGRGPGDRPAGGRARLGARPGRSRRRSSGRARPPSSPRCWRRTAVLPPEILAALDEVSAPALGYPERR